MSLNPKRTAVCNLTSSARPSVARAIIRGSIISRSRLTARFSAGGSVHRWLEWKRLRYCCSRSFGK
eukprot:283981-Pleurochrysis_carterae.AAC.2